jgi:glycerate-2-kinase
VNGEPARRTLEAVLRAALAAADAGRAVRGAVVEAGSELALGGRRVPGGARLVVAAAGKAAGAMASGLEAVAGARVARGLVVTKDGHARAAPGVRCRVREAGHPVPDARSEAAARELLALAASTGPDDVLVVLLSGGASALLACPLPGLGLDDLAATTRLLLASGAEIGEVNAVRKHLAEIAGGRLARAAGAGRVEVLAVSDVIGDAVDVIGSGPCAPDPTTFGDALGVLARRGLLGRVPARVREHLEAGTRGEREETPKPGDPCFRRVRTTVVASLATALAAAAREARARGLRTWILSRALRGEARAVGRRLAALGLAVRGSEPVCLLAGGETTVTLGVATPGKVAAPGSGPGLGGRNQELALAAALALAGRPGVTLLAAGTDGSDGPTDAAGAFADGGTVARAASRGWDASAALARHDSHSFFAAEGGLLRTGPTGTNVMDVAALHVAAAAPEGGGAAPPGSNAAFPKPSESV